MANLSSKIATALRRAYLTSRLRYHRREIARLDALRSAIGPALDAELRAEASIRGALVMLEIGRRTPTVAMSGGPRDGVVRSIGGAQ